MKTFTFDFYNEDTEISTIFSCKVSEDPLLLIPTEAVEHFCLDIEDYGVHDVSYDPEKSYFGFTSYEVSPSDYQLVFDKWLKFFSDKGITVANTTHIEEIHDNETTL